MAPRTRATSAVALASLLVLPGQAAASIGGLPTPKTQTYYVIMAHPDDEANAWSVIEKRPPTDYLIFVTMTRGEATASCLPAEESQHEDPPYGPNDFLAESNDGKAYRTGPYKYQGPDSPVGEPNLGERHPLGSPWNGRGTEACAAAGIASWHWFLDDAHHVDGTGTDMGVVEDPELDDDYRGEFCPPGFRGKGGGRSIEKKVGCAKVWANTQSARIAFNLPDYGFPIPIGADLWGVEEVTSAIQTVRSQRAAWRIPVLPEAGMVSASGHYDGDEADCLFYDHPDHKAIQDTLFFVDQGAGPQMGPISHTSVAPGVHNECSSDPYLQDSERVDLPRNFATVVAHNLIDPNTKERIGPFVVNYGWRLSTFYFGGSFEIFWRQFG